MAQNVSYDFEYSFLWDLFHNSSKGSYSTKTDADPTDEAAPIPKESPSSKPTQSPAQEVPTCCICFEELGRPRPGDTPAEHKVVLPECQQ